MNKKNIKNILAIESSCDESAAAVVVGENKNVIVLSNIISSQIEIHKKYGGVVPEIAAREHVYNILPVIQEALIQANLDKNEINAIAVTQGPGLIASLHIGTETAKAIAKAWNIPLIPIHHVESHIYANFINNTSVEFPAVILTVSGGHTALYLMKNHGELELIGETIDDAAGEAFDKGAQLMNLGYPGGPLISVEAEKFHKPEKSISNISLPRPLLNKKNFNFSFSGLKTALLYQLQKDPAWKTKIPEYCFEYQEAIVETLVKKTLKAAEKYQTKTVMIAGGVSANKRLREYLIEHARINYPNIKINIPDIKYTTDNAAMVGACAFFKLCSGNLRQNNGTITADPNLELK